MPFFSFEYLRLWLKTSKRTVIVRNSKKVQTKFRGCLTLLLVKMPYRTIQTKCIYHFEKKKLKNVAKSLSCFAVEAHLNGDNPRLGL